MTHSFARPRAVALIVGVTLALAALMSIGKTASKPFVPTASAARADYYLKIDDIKGESETKGHQGEIEVNSWSFGTSNPTSSVGSAGLSAGKVSYSDLSVMKYIDKASPKLFLACASGEHFKQATVTIPGAKGEDRLRYTFFDVFCESVTHAGTGSDRPTESISLNYQKIMIEYKAKSSTTWETVGWDIAANKKI